MSGSLSCCGYHELGVGDGFACAVHDQGTSCWGALDDKLLSIPMGFFHDLAVGVKTVCVLEDSDDEAYCWGWNDHGQADPPPGIPFDALTVGGDHACGIQDVDGQVLCWGNEDDGRLDAPPGVAMEWIDAGVGYTCAVATTGEMHCWCLNDPRYDMAVARDGDRWRQVAAGWTHSCAIDQDGRLGCWGNDLFGQASPP